MAIPNPAFPKLCFPYDEDTKRVFLCQLYCEMFGEGGPDKYGNYRGEMEPDDIDVLCCAIKEELKLELLDWAYVGGMSLIHCSIQDIQKSYDIINAFLKRGKRIYMNDGSEVTFDPVDHASPETQQEQIKQSIEHWLKPEGMFHLRYITSLYPQAVWTNEFWTIPGGREVLARAIQLLDALEG